MNPTVDVIIPTYKPDERFAKLVAMLEQQSYPVGRIIVMNTEEKYMDAFLDGRRDVGTHKSVRIHHLSRREFDHGGTRRKGVSKSDAGYFLCMTQDAVPTDTDLVKRLVDAFSGNEDGKGEIAVSYARQMPWPDASPITSFTRGFNYPENSLVKSKADLGTLGIKTYFCSNVCAMYDRKIFDALGGFIRRTIFNEDMIYAAKAITMGYRIAYVADAKVFHSHEYGAVQELRRNFDLGVSQADHPEVFENIRSEGEGVKLVKMTASYLRSIGRTGMIVRLIALSGAKYIGYLLGKHYRSLPKWLVMRLTMNKQYWK
ncbi:MAG: glycosyltransferase [Lachnospiraceae bacterium]|nr:glycosyltransferase [Lachnospiraceae bacterium]